MTKTAIPALDRTVALLDLMSQQQDALPAAEIVRRLGIPRSSGHALLSALLEHGLLYKNNQQGYTLGAQVMHWSSGFLAQQNVVNAFQNEIVPSQALAPFSLTLTLREAREVICLACRNGDSRLGFSFSLGLRLPAGFAATGKAMLSTLSDEEVNEIYGDYWHPPLTPYSVPDCETLLKQLAEVRECGYSTDDCCIREGMFCIGVPVFDHSNQANRGIALSMQRTEATPEHVAKLGSLLRCLADNISRRLGATIV